MKLRADKDGVVYLDFPNHDDVIIIFQDIHQQYIVESRRFGTYGKKFNDLVSACMFVHQKVINDEW